MVFYYCMCCVCVFSLHREHLDMILGDKPLISEVVLSQEPRLSRKADITDRIFQYDMYSIKPHHEKDTSVILITQQKSTLNL
jgi:hypothetical protein